MQFRAMMLASLMAVVSMTAPVQAAEGPRVPHLITSGTGSVEVMPDMATLLIEVTSTHKDAALAKKQVDEQVARYFDFLLSKGVVKSDIAAANVRTYPEYSSLSSKSSEPVLKGYRAQRSVEVKVRQLDSISDLLDGALKAGLNEIRFVSFGVSSPEKYQAQARQKAIENAIEQGHALAQGFGSQLGPVFSIRYRDNGTPPMPMRAYAMAPADAMEKTSVGETYQQDKVTFSDQVDVIFELKR